MQSVNDLALLAGAVLLFSVVYFAVEFYLCRRKGKKQQRKPFHQN